MAVVNIYEQRRKNLNENLQGEPAVFTAFNAMQQTNDGAAPFVQESSFFWLTGLDEPNWKVLLFEGESWLIAPTKTDIQRIFDGGMSSEEAQEISGIAGVLSEEELTRKLEEIALKHARVHTTLKHSHSEYFDFELNPALGKLEIDLGKVFTEVVDCRRELSKLKAIKSPQEIELIQKAINISIDGFNKVRDSLASMRHEYEVEATLSYAFRAAGSQGHAYQPIVGTGVNACTLHYIENNDPLPENGMVLIDAGARVHGYAADITRTYAIGTPSSREQQVHSEVEKAHQAIIALIKPGLSFKDYHDKVKAIMKQAIDNLNLLKTADDYQRYFPHAISHGLGIDVHDSLGGYETLQPGMVLTVEPGIYITEEGIGVRIEDDILVTKSGHTNLSAALPTSL
jgi:Xaa-Pro aminopeptidase